MADGVVMKSGKTVKIDGHEWDIRDGDSRTVFVDFITENRINNGVLHLSLGSVHTDVNNAPIVEVSTRIRMDIATAQILHRTLGNLIREFQIPPEKVTRN